MRRRGKWARFDAPAEFKRTDGRKILKEDPIDKALYQTKVPVSQYLNEWVLD